MPAYLIVTREEPLQDPQAYAEYQRLNREQRCPIPVTPKVVYGTQENLEGAAPDGVIMLEFATMEDAKAWYNSPEYQKALPFRLQSAKHRAFIVEGL